MRVRLSNAPRTLLPAGGLVARFFSLDGHGDVQEQLGRVPVRDGVAPYRAPPAPDAGLRFAIAVEESNTAGCVYRSGALDPVAAAQPQLDAMQVSIVYCPGVALDLGPDATGPDSVLSRHIEQMLPPQLRLAGVAVRCAGEGSLEVTMSGWVQIATRRIPFAHGRTLRLRCSADPARRVPCIRALIEGGAVVGGELAAEQRAMLDRAISDGVALQLDAAVRHIAGLRNASFVTDVKPQTHSVSRIRVAGQKGRPPELELNISWAAATGADGAPLAASDMPARG